jgi:hypothetical protein
MTADVDERAGRRRCAAAPAGADDLIERARRNQGRDDE